MKSKVLAAAILIGTAGIANAADAVIDDVVVVDSAYNWSGVYVGGVVGYGWGDSRFEDSFPEPSNSFDIDGAFGGLTVGYNYQFVPNWVVGLEADVSFSGIKGSFGPGNLDTPSGTGWGCSSGPCTTEIDWYGTARARLGYAVNNFLLYGTGGLAVGRVESRIENTTDYVIEDTNVGWAAGAGVEYAFTQNWTAKLEYMHVDLGWTDRNVEQDFRSDAELDTVRFGINYKF